MVKKQQGYEDWKIITLIRELFGYEREVFPSNIHLESDDLGGFSQVWLAQGEHFDRSLIIVNALGDFLFFQVLQVTGIYLKSFFYYCSEQF
ncbi:hypothetical protein D4T97_001975 [Siminovitchia acidinfaciens]|uniref:Uncharacterized protein n=1 Tax=Siminovitchia acidinfaciens TaxID=2321395 RepID=A0A429Y778_9BACI|nr:hypothetical protein D4T97_001975 [Siminovitchia acidinfaciens]